MKKLLSILLVLAIMLTFSACGADGKDGKDGVTPTIEISEDGYWIINGVKTEYKAIGTDGKDGKDGKDGYTPTIDISADGYWVINGQKTNVKATPDEVDYENYQELSFYQQDDGTYLVACGTSKYLSKIIIPDTYKGAAVVGICERAFQPPSKSGSGYTMYEKTYLESIVIPNSITSIGNSAFYYCTSLETIEFEGTVEQWNAIEKGGNWNYYVSATEVICSDGVVPLN